MREAARRPPLACRGGSPAAVPLSAMLASLACAACGTATEPTRQPMPVAIQGSAAEGYRILRGDRPFVLRGVGGETRLDLVAACGGTAIRTWGIESCRRTIDGRPLLDAALHHGLTVTVGIWLGHERHGFDYGDRRQLERQRAAVEDAVRHYKDHPAVLFWGLGNEMEGPMGPGTSPAIWREVNELACRVKRLDPHHPVMPVVANVTPDKIRAILEHAPDVELLGVNAYANVASVGRTLRDHGWTKPYCITECGLPGPWEAPRTAWQAPIEPSSREKAASTAAACQAIAADDRQCLGGYVFYWGHKQEATSSWFGMLLPGGEKTPRVDAVAHAWTGRWPSDRAPVLEQADVPIANATLEPGTRAHVHVRYADAEVLAPAAPGAYRLFVTVTDPAGSAAVDNWCFRVTD